MKNEDKIVQQLAESLKKQDQMIESMESTEMRIITTQLVQKKFEDDINQLTNVMIDFKEIVTSQSKSLEGITKILDRQEEEIKSINLFLHNVFDVKKEMSLLRERIERLEQGS